MSDISKIVKLEKVNTHMKKAIIFGAGKIARGFIAHLLYLSNFEIVFVDVDEDLVNILNNKKKYTIHVMGNEKKNIEIDHFKAFHLSDTDQIAKEWVESQISFTTVGGKNLKSLSKIISDIFEKSIDISKVERPFNLITCENWTEPAKELREGIIHHLRDAYIEQFSEWVGVTEAVILRSAVEPTEEVIKKDPLTVYVQDLWDLPINKKGFKGEPILFHSARYIENFKGFLERKFYTNNSANSAYAYLGALKNFTYIYEAANDPEISELVDKVYDETGAALMKKYNITEEHEQFVNESKRKYKNKTIVDYVERHARDPIRKLGVQDRLVGAARLVMAYGEVPHGLATAIAAALYYVNMNDKISLQLQNLRKSKGIEDVLYEISNINPDEPLCELIKEKVDFLKERGLINE